MMTRKIKPMTYQVRGDIPIPDPLAELEKQAGTGAYEYLLAFAHDGVIWGSVQDGRLRLSGNGFPEISPVLRPATLWELRLFGRDAEWHLWRAEAGWRACLVRDGEGDAGSALDEQYMLWGTDPDRPGQGGFWPVHEADLGILHAPPVEMKSRHSLRLSVRHYMGHDEAGTAYVILSRLTGLENGGAE
jgi:CRISPR-associated protein (TIGR03984 family)